MRTRYALINIVWQTSVHFLVISVVYFKNVVQSDALTFGTKNLKTASLDQCWKAYNDAYYMSRAVLK